MAGIVADFEALRHERDPVSAGEKGDLAALPLWPDDRPAAIEAYDRSLKALRDRLAAVAPAGLCHEQALNQALLEDRIGLDIDGIRFDEARIPFAAGDGFYTDADYAADDMVIRTEAEARGWVAKIRALPGYYTVATENMRRGIATGFLRPKLTVTNTITALRAHVAVPVADHVLLRPLKAMPDAIPAATRTALLAEATEAVESGVRPAETRLLHFFETEYLPKAPEALGIGGLPSGRDYYQYLIHRYASTAMTPEEIHHLGETEIARIRQEMEADIQATGHTGSFKDFLAFIRTDKQFIAASPEDFYDRVSGILIRVNGKLPQYFRHLPSLPLTVREVSPAMRGSSSGYNPGSPQQGVAGAVMINTTHLDRDPLPGLVAWALHEGVPGHHLQIALAQETPGLPDFRRKDDINAFVEGWGLYAEHLGIEMGMYRTPYEDFGRLSYEMWRACRLVMDTGLHVMGWTRDQARACLADNTGLSQATIDYETDRYISWPGQALGYEIGVTRIRELRAKAEAALGPRFDIRDFHDVVLRDGPLPLDVLASEVDAWIAGGGK